MLFPVILVTALLVRIKLGSPVFFRQNRIGKNHRGFTLIKFRTMNNTSDESGKLLSDEERITRFGTLLRRTSLDELPTLLNVLKGDMSFVGPRPLLPEYMEVYTDEQKRRHEVRPGITGWAQINGRNAQRWEERFAHDIWYVDNCSLWLDIKILFKTVLKVIRQDGVSAEGHVTMQNYVEYVKTKQSSDQNGEPS